MKGYTAKDLETLFSRAGRIRKGKSKYAGDAGYWDGGHCDYGASHNLREDCETLAEAFSKIEGLEEIKDTLKQCTSEVEFNSKKRDFIRKCEEAINGLRPNIGSHSSMFGICIIWGEEAMNKHVETKIQGCKKEIEKIKSTLEKESYKWVEELRQIELEINEINARMEENKRKAMDPNISPSEKAALLEEIEADGKLLKQKYEEHRKHSNKFRFDPAQKVRDMVDAMRRAIEGKSGGSGSDGDGGDPDKPRRPRKPDDSSDDDNDNKGNGNNNDNGNNKRPTRKKKQPEQNNQQMLLIGIVVIVALFLLMNQKEPQPHRRYDEYDYY